MGERLHSKEFTSELFDANWGRFDRYAGYVRSIHYDQALGFRGRRGLLSNRTLAYMFLHRPNFESSMFPKLASVKWTVEDTDGFTQLLLFLVPTITTLRISCRGFLEDDCIKVLKTLAPRNIHLTELRIAMRMHTQAFLDGLADVFEVQRGLIRVGVPHYSASQRVVATLATLPSLEQYELWGFVEYQHPLEIGMDFDWELQGFTTLKTFALFTPLNDAAKVMSRPHQPHLNDFTLISREFLEHAQLRNLCSSLSALQPSLTVLYLSLYSGTVGPDPSSQTIPFDLIRPLLMCTSLQELCIRSDMALEYKDEDIASMASAWPSLGILSLCADPVSDVRFATGQPLQSVGSFTQYFRALRELSLYVNALDIQAILGVFARSRLSVLDFGTSPIPTKSAVASDLSRARYMTSLLVPHAKIKSERSNGHKRFLETSLAAKEEYARRERFWSKFAAEVYEILSGATDPARETLGHRAEVQCPDRSRVKPQPSYE
ncbi:hypothetical protein FRB97_001207 [Tulasnella sp. 331]|nr:hypothetical protein FRB97_001207 [Tulasnella sp. 331]